VGGAQPKGQGHTTCSSGSDWQHNLKLQKWGRAEECQPEDVVAGEGLRPMGLGVFRAQNTQVLGGEALADTIPLHDKIISVLVTKKKFRCG